MNASQAYFFVFVYGAFIFCVLQLVTAEGGVIYTPKDAIVVSLFILNGLVSLAGASPELNLFALFFSSSCVLVGTLANTNLNKRWSLTYIFTGAALLPPILVMFFASTSCLVRYAGVACLLGYGAVLLGRTSQRDLTDDAELAHRASAVAAVSLQVLGGTLALDDCGPLPGVQASPALAGARFLTCCLLAYAASFERVFSEAP
jgi:hypothetical protein